MTYVVIILVSKSGEIDSRIIADGGKKQIEKFEKYKLKQENIGPPSLFVLQCTVNFLYMHRDLLEVRKSIKKLKRVKCTFRKIYKSNVF
jgi:hypothetical protein